MRVNATKGALIGFVNTLGWIVDDTNKTQNKLSSVIVCHKMMSPFDVQGMDWLMVVFLYHNQ